MPEAEVYMSDEEYLTTTQVGKRLGVTGVTVLRWIKLGYVHGKRKGVAPKSGWLVPESEVCRLEAQLAGNMQTQGAGDADEAQTQ